MDHFQVRQVGHVRRSSSDLYSIKVRQSKEELLVMIPVYQRGEQERIEVER